MTYSDTGPVESHIVAFGQLIVHIRSHYKGSYLQMLFQGTAAMSVPIPKLPTANDQTLLCRSVHLLIGTDVDVKRVRKCSKQVVPRNKISVNPRQLFLKGSSTCKNLLCTCLLAPVDITVNVAGSTLFLSIRKHTETPPSKIMHFSSAEYRSPFYR